ncbi:hypothetical protein OL233_08205 [Vagococcus sp. PNs007]|uniref:Uncharacterized protein n=2 Tax=Vagococcus proximus TaxID=2991417 RepID=A0ABT5X2N9_9ENTE|nr:hypothetical protein [Vagococcus proximus]
MRATPYIDKKFYDDVFNGVSVEATDFEKFVVRASDVIDQVTAYQIGYIGLSQFSDLVVGLIKKATAAQVEYYQLEGVDIDTTGSDSDAKSVSVGKFSYTGSQGDQSKQAARVGPNVLAYLDGTNLVKKNEVRMRVI